jgi:hypothetical protein
MKTYAIYEFAAKVAFLGYISAETEAQAIKAASREFEVEARLLRAAERGAHQACDLSKSSN